MQFDWDQCRTIQIKLDGAKSDAFLLVDVIHVDFLDFFLFFIII